MASFPLHFKGVIKFTIGGLAFEIFVVFFHLGDALMLFHHFLEVASALCGRSGS